jgi:hypothetical protein
MHVINEKKKSTFKFRSVTICIHLSYALGQLDLYTGHEAGVVQTL